MFLHHVPLKTDKPKWSGQDIKGQTVLLYCEGTTAEQIKTIRFALDLNMRGADVTVSCSRSLMPLFRSITYINALIENDGAHHADFDYWISSHHVQDILNLKDEDVDGLPYLQKPYPYCFGGPVNIGIHWQGLNEIEALKSGDPRQKFYIINNDLMDRGWLDTAQFIAGLDLLITYCNTTAHLAGAMGIPVWVLVPKIDYFVRGIHDLDVRWYDSMVLFKQQQNGSWDSVFQMVREELQTFTPP